jgi:arylsulfatase A-like enzyme
MDRREFLKQGVAVSTSAALSLPASAAQTTPRKKPNVLYVFSDQHRAQSMPGEPLCEAVAPTLDRFRKENLSMDACISNYHLCVPHRAILMSGQYSWQTKVYHNEHRLEPRVPGLGNVFQSAVRTDLHKSSVHLS